MWIKLSNFPWRYRIYIPKRLWRLHTCNGLEYLGQAHRWRVLVRPINLILQLEVLIIFDDAIGNV